MKRVHTYQMKKKWNKRKIILTSNKCMHLHERERRQKLFIMKEQK